MAHSNPPIPDPKKKKRRKKWPWIILVLILALVAYGAVRVNRQVADLYAQDVAKTRDISTYYSFSGNLTPVTNKVQTAKEALKIKELYVKEGDVVQAGQALLRGTEGTRVLAAESGTVDELYVDPQDQLQPGSQIARIVDYATLEISVDVDEYDIGALSLGKQGKVYLNALEETVTGTVSEIARDATKEGGVSFYGVKLQIEAAENIRSGMSVEVTMLNKEAKGCVSLSLKALAYDEYNKPYVLVKNQDGGMSVRYVETGVSDGQNVQILQGLAEGETAYYMSLDMSRFFTMGGPSSGSMREMRQSRDDMEAAMGN